MQKWQWEISWAEAIQFKAPKWREDRLRKDGTLLLKTMLLSMCGHMTVEIWNATDGMKLRNDFQNKFKLFKVHWMYDPVRMKPWFRLTKTLRDLPGVP